MATDSGSPGKLRHPGYPGTFPAIEVPTKGDHEFMEGLYHHGSPANVFPDIKKTMTDRD